MKKRNLLFIGLGILVIIAASVTVYMLNRPTAATPVRYAVSYATAKSMPITAKCLAENAKPTISAGDRNTVEQVAMSHLSDVPAGTNVEIVIASYSKDYVTGSDYYPDTYGSYNFAMNKRANGDWQFTDFQHCR